MVVTILTLRERIHLTRLRREVERGDRDEYICEPQERAWIAFLRWDINRRGGCQCYESDHACDCATDSNFAY